MSIDCNFDMVGEKMPAAGTLAAISADCESGLDSETRKEMNNNLNLKFNRMKNLATILVLTLFSLISSSLKAEEFAGYYVTNNLDTVHCVFVLQKKHGDFYDFSMLTKTVILGDQGGTKKFKPHEIVCFAINIPNEGTYKFVSLKEDKKQFFHEIINGKISLYKTYSRHPYDGSLTILPIAHKDNQLVYLNVVNRKQRVSNLLKDNPVILEKWTATKSNAWTGSWFDTTEIEKYIREYNEFDTVEK